MMKDTELTHAGSQRSALGLDVWLRVYCQPLLPRVARSGVTCSSVKGSTALRARLGPRQGAYGVGRGERVHDSIDKTRHALYISIRN